MDDVAGLVPEQGGTDVATLEAPEPQEVETPEAQQPSGDEAIGQGHGQETEGEAGQQPEAQGEETEKAGQEPLPSQVSKLLRELRESNPDSRPIVRQLQDSYFKARSYGELFPSVDDARATKATLEALGGSDGIVDLQNRARMLETVDEMVDRGDPKIIEDMAAESPEGFKKLIPHALSVLERLDAKGYDELIKPSLVRALGNSGLRESLGRALQFLRSGNADYAQNELGQIAGWLQRLEQSEQSRGQQQADPRTAEIEQRERALQERESHTFQEGVGREVLEYVRPKITAAMRPLFKGRELPKEGIEEFATSVIREVNSALGSDKAYQTNAAALMRTRDMNRIMPFIKAHVDRLLQKSVSGVFTRRYGMPNAPRQRTAGTTTRTNGNGANPPANQGKALMLPAKPNVTQIDWAKDPDRILYISGRAYLKDGRLVTWRKTA